MRHLHLAFAVANLETMVTQLT
ncbi:hypothetical protein CY0110_17232 [Crocosphaera chwakensis CCY0110]|uniref:Uncharacterized protein n=1 Tax=Crocosphaera chwakensis CCY0110 TaxID=391612 RepID=A3IIC8_9CHRO|nr:hypothetical protein CY0110_17232 [Crocosphaera chwakensis CCY0110]